MKTWVLAVAGALTAISCLLLVQYLRAILLRRYLRRLAAKRDAIAAFALLQAEFPGVEPPRLRAAYVWVQELVAIDSMPLHPNDDLSATLRVDQGAVDDKLEASYECYGKEKDGGAASSSPLSTVKQLIGAVLASGYEHYPERVKRSVSENAA